jgi:hypothetical protein
MGKVVKLEAAAGKAKARTRVVAARGVGRPPSAERRRRPRRDKTALVLGGGGFTGGVYEIGALRALDLLAVNSNVNDFDVYVGTSAGSFIAALCANGVTPEEMMRRRSRTSTSATCCASTSASSSARARSCRCAPRRSRAKCCSRGAARR